MNGLMLARRGAISRHPDSSSSFVTRDPSNGHLMLNGQRFRFGGANVANDIGTVGTANGNHYGGIDHGGSYLTTHAQADALVASVAAMGLTVLKATWSIHTTNHVDAVQPSLGVFNPAALDPIDYAISICKPLGIRFILPFCENYTAKPWYCTANGVSAGSPDGSGNYPAPLFYTNATVIASYKAHMSFVLNHLNPYTGVKLKDESQIICWETGNEFVGVNTNAEYATWADDIGHHIKIVEGAKQLVQDGHYGIISESLASPYTDIYDQHVYDQYRTPSFLAAEAGPCHTAGKAYFIGEFDWTDNPEQPGLIHTNWFLDGMLDFYERSPDIDGGTFWDFLAPLTAWDDGYGFRWPGDTSDMVARGDMLSDWARRMVGITPKTFMSDTLTGANGTALPSHVGEVGATWNYQGTFEDPWNGALTIQNNRVYSGVTESHCFTSGVPASADYTVNAKIYTASVLSGAYAGVLARCYTRKNYSYAAYVWNNGGTVGIYLDYYFPGSHTVLRSQTITTPMVGSTHDIKLVVDGSTLSVYWDDALAFDPITHTSLPAAGRAGIILGGGGSPATGFHLDNPEAIDD